MLFVYRSETVLIKIMRFLSSILIISFLLFPGLAYGDDDSELRYTVSGHIRDASSGEELIGASVLIKQLKKGSVTNLYGFYSI